MLHSRFLILLLVLPVVVGSCAEFEELATGQGAARTSCANPMINRAIRHYEEAKTGLALYYEEQNDNRLFQAYYASADSVMTARRVGKCWDRRASHKIAYDNLKELNLEVRKIIRRNMPDAETAGLVALYRDQYEKVVQRRD